MRDDEHPLLGPWERLVKSRGDAVALEEVAAGRTWSFREVNRRSEILAEKLGEEICAGQPVTFQEENGGEWLARFLALLRWGAPALPVDAATPVAGVREIAAECGAVFWAAEGGLEFPARARRYRAPAIALVKLTSGTTGKPKRLPFRAEELAADGWQIMEGMGIGEGDRNFAIIPFGHSYGIGNLVMPLLLRGVPVVCGSSPLPHVLAAEFAEGKATVLPAVPAIFAGLIRAEARLEGLRLAISAGAALLPETARAFLEIFGQPLHNFLGSSESGGIAYDLDGEAGLTGRSVGKPLPSATISFHRSGRIMVTSPAVFTRGNPGGRVMLEDRGAWNGLGELVLAGRVRPMIKVGARRLDPLELERVLRQIDGVSEAWVTGWKTGGEMRPAAVVSSRRAAKELRAVLRERLPAWKIPRPLVVITDFPLTARGKPDREALQRYLLPK